MEISYDASKHYLGRLCSRSHDWNGTGQSVRYASTRGCIACEAERYLRNKQDEKWFQQRRDYNRSRVAEIRAAEGRQYRGTSPALQGLTLPAGIGKGTTRLLSKHGLLRPGMALEEIQILAQTRRQLDLLKDVGKLPTVAQLVEQEQRRYWSENPGTRREHTRQFYTDLSWLNYQLSPSTRILHREKSKRRKAKMKGNIVAQVSAQQIRDRFAEFNGCCAYCGAEGDLHIEHFIPISKGGTHVMGNILPACQPCNYSKRDRDAEQWYRAQPFFTEQRWRRIRSVLGLTATTGQLSFL